MRSGRREWQAEATRNGNQVGKSKASNADPTLEPIRFHTHMRTQANPTSRLGREWSRSMFCQTLFFSFREGFPVPLPPTPDPGPHSASGQTPILALESSMRTPGSLRWALRSLEMVLA